MAHKEIFPIRVNLVSFLNDFYSLRDKIDISYRVVSITFAKLLNNVSISLVARNNDGLVVGVLFGLTDFCYWLYITDLGVDRNYERNGIATRLMRKAHELSGGEKDIAVYLIANDNAVPFYKKLGMKYADDVMQYNHIEWTKWKVE